MKRQIPKVFFAFFLLFPAILFSSCYEFFFDDLDPDDKFSLKVCDSISDGGGYFYTLTIERDFNMNTSEHHGKNSLFFKEYKLDWLLEYYDETSEKFTDADKTFFILDNAKNSYDTKRTRSWKGVDGGSIWISEKMYAKYTIPGTYRFSVTLTGTNKNDETKILHTDSKEFICE